ncbi:MAG: hypothetical protein LAP38_17795 [Acidobacteriia bacterium]|nr:hypothetical protein [Terriglobia bacterium]
MGLVLDSGVLIAAERDAKPVSELLFALEREHGETEIVLAAVTVVELEHSLHRAQTSEQLRKRRDYLDTVFAAIPPDLLIGATALHFGYSIGTRNLRHFRMIPSLPVVQL